MTKLISCLVYLLLVAAIAPGPLRAASVEQVSLQEMVERCELVLEGRVVGQRVAAGKGKREIFTYVTLEVLELVKGDYAAQTVELRYLGGSLGGRTLRVADLHPPHLGERGVFFVERLHSSPAHPLYGWEQGHYRIVADPQSRREVVQSFRGRPIYGIDEPRTRLKAGLSTGVASGLRLAPETGGESPMDAAEFKRALKSILGGPREP